MSAQADPLLMERVIGLAVDNVRSGRGGPFGALVVCGGDVVADGTNLVTSANDPTAHAEVVAIRRACQARQAFDLRGCELYASCEPCPMCLAAAYWARVDRIWYACGQEDAAAAGFDDSFLYRELALPGEARTLPAGSTMREQGLKAFRAWAASTAKIPY